MQNFDIEMDKADEVEIAFYDQQGGQKNPPPRVLIGVMWLKVSDLLEALRRQKVEGLDGDGAGWVTAATVRDRDGGSSGGRGGRNGDVDAPLGQQGLTAGGHVGGGPSSSGHGGASDGLDGWFNVEPQGAVNFHLDFGSPLSRVSSLLRLLTDPPPRYFCSQGERPSSSARWRWRSRSTGRRQEEEGRGPRDERP